MKNLQQVYSTLKEGTNVELSFDHQPSSWLVPTERSIVVHNFMSMNKVQFDGILQSFIKSGGNNGLIAKFENATDVRIEAAQSFSSPTLAVAFANRGGLKKIINPKGALLDVPTPQRSGTGFQKMVYMSQKIAQLCQQ